MTDRCLQERTAALRRLIENAEASGISECGVEEVLAEAKALAHESARQRDTEVQGRSSRNDLNGDVAVVVTAYHMIQRMNPYRFRTFTMWQRSHLTSYTSEDVSYWSTEDESLLGLVFRDLCDADYGYVVLARDRLGRFRAVNVDVSIATRRMAETQLFHKLENLKGEPVEEFYQGDEFGVPMDLFTPIVVPERMNDLFKNLIESENSTPALSVLRELSLAYEDRDGNFVENFQSISFSQRLWELYIYAATTSMGFSLIKDFKIPDFTLQKLDQLCT